MSKQEKKVVLFIVEGPSDEAAIGPIMKEYFANDNVEFKVVHGDITSDKNVNSENIIKKINEQLEVVKEKYRYKDTDFKEIIHIVDTDGAFIHNDYIIESEVSGVMYYEDHIETFNKSALENRNASKSSVLLKLITTKTIKRIPYRVYFNSCNLEHVLYGELKNFSDEEKEIMADDFSDKYADDLGAFINFISNLDIAIDGTYKDTWKFIQKDINSLQRHSNMNLIFNSKALDYSLEFEYAMEDGHLPDESTGKNIS